MIEVVGKIGMKLAEIESKRGLIQDRIQAFSVNIANVCAIAERSLGMYNYFPDKDDYGDTSESDASQVTEFIEYVHGEDTKIVTIEFEKSDDSSRKGFELL